MDTFFESKYHDPNIEDNAVTAMPVPAITNPPKTNESKSQFFLIYSNFFAKPTKQDNKIFQITA